MLVTEGDERIADGLAGVGVGSEAKAGAGGESGTKNKSVAMRASAINGKMVSFIYEENKNRPHEFRSPADESEDIISVLELKSKTDLIFFIT